MHQIRRLIVLTRQGACRLFDIQGAPLAGEYPSYIASNAGPSLPNERTIRWPERAWIPKRAWTKKGEP